MRFLTASILLLAVVCVLDSRLYAAGPFADAPPPGQPDAPSPKTGPDGKVWEITKFLTGTAPQIRDQLNGETERLIVHYRALKNDLAKADADYKQAFQDATNRLQKDPTRPKLQTEQQKAEADKQALQKDGSPDLRLDAATRASHARQELEHYQRDFFQKNTDLVTKQKALAEVTENLTRCRDSIGKAQQWRLEIIEAAIRNTYSIDWPFHRGFVGLLSKVTPVEIDAPNESAVVKYEAREYIQFGKEVEGGIVQVMYRPHDVLMRISGIDTKGMVRGQEITLDQAFEMVGVERVDDHPVYTAKRSPGDLEPLLNLVVPLRETMDPKELAALVIAAQTPKKAHPRRWLGVPALLSAIPANRRPSAHHRWDTETVGKANEWLSAEAVGDHLETMVEIRSIDPVKDGFFTLHGGIEVPIPGGQGNALHSIDAKCPAAALPRIQKMKRGQKIKLAGTIRGIRILSDGTTIVDLVDGAV